MNDTLLERLKTQEHLMRWMTVIYPKARGMFRFNIESYLAERNLIEVTRGPLQYISGKDLGVDDRFARLFLNYWFANTLARETGTSEFVLSITGQQVVTSTGDEPDTAYIVETGVGTLVFVEDHSNRVLTLHSESQETFNAIFSLVVLMDR